MADLLLSTKLFIPFSRGKQIDRQRLTDQLDTGIAQGSRLILVSGPAGFGKSTLLSEWLRHSSMVSTWVSLDHGDNDWVQFLSYFIAALQKIAPDFGQSILPALHAPQLPPPESLLAQLINEICSLPEFAMVLDDYHVVDTDKVHQTVAFLLDYLPRNMHLVIATRVDPPFMLARLRAAGEMVEIRTDDLRFTVTETNAFLTEIAQVKVTQTDLLALDERTEGWVAGLKIAALSMQGKPPDWVSDFIRAFSGSHRYILDYLLEEVIHQQNEETRAFMLETSILDRLNGDVSDAVTGSSDGREMLSALEKANLFLIPLDEERQWYRYHHLFADLLRMKLSQHYPSQQIREQHIRASDWFAQNNFIDDALTHAFKAEDYDRARQLVNRYWQPVMHQGFIRKALGWFEVLPADIVREDLETHIAYCWALFLGGQNQALEDHLPQVVSRYKAQVIKPENIMVDSHQIQIWGLQAIVARNNGAYADAIAFSRKALSHIPDEAVLLKGTSTIGLAHAYRLSGEINLAVETYRQAIPLLRSGGNFIASTIASYYLVSLYLYFGKLHEAYDTCQDALQFADKNGQQEFPAYGMIHIALANILREWNQLAQAEAHLQQGMRLGRSGGFEEALKNGYFVWGRLELAKGEVAQAQAVFEQAQSLLAEHGLALSGSAYQAIQAWLCVKLGDLAGAAVWHGKMQASIAGSESADVLDVEQVISAGVEIALGDYEQSAQKLTRFLEKAKAEERLGSVLEILVLRALAFQAQARQELALDSLAEAVRLAVPEKYMRVFLDEGAVMHNMLLQLRKRSGISTGWLDQLLEAFNREKTLMRSIIPKTGVIVPLLKSDQQGLLESLSPRELEVLRCMADGLTYRKTAENLVISVGTVKTHIHNIYTKLEVENRTQALRAAKDLNLI
jgi:LuxR family maltose regulon positive regulatory protein